MNAHHLLLRHMKKKEIYKMLYFMLQRPPNNQTQKMILITI